MYELTSAEVIGERNIESRKNALEKRGWTTVPPQNVFVTAFAHINKEIAINVSNSKGIVNSFSTF